MFGKNLWKKKFKYWPTWPCPTCFSVAVSLEKNTLKSIETGPSARQHGEDYWNPEMITERFTAILKCRNPSCGEVFSVCGNSEIEQDFSYDHEGQTQIDYQSVFEPQFFNPPLPVFAIPLNCPDEVSLQLTSAFSLIWHDLESCANRMRSGVEALLDDRSVSKTTLTAKKKRVPLTLHSRIELFKKKQPEAAEFLMAIKWIGNYGSHKSTKTMSVDDLLNGFEFFEAALDLLYVSKAVTLKKMAAKVTKRKGRPLLKKAISSYKK
jgi:hypothetical protein